MRNLPYCETFDGDSAAAKKRLKRLASLACKELPIDQMNLVAFNIAVYLDVHRGTKTLTRTQSAELEGERESILRRLIDGDGGAQ